MQEKFSDENGKRGLFFCRELCYADICISGTMPMMGERRRSV